MPDLDQITTPPPKTSTDREALEGILTKSGTQYWVAIDGQAPLWGPVLGGSDTLVGQRVAIVISQKSRPFVVWPASGGGTTGDKGPTGDQGPVGDKGPTGDQGPQGVTGDKGPVGDKGAIGDKGPTGDKGATGDQGASYENAPLGTIQGWSRKTLPDGWVMADGATYTQAAFPEGYAVAQAEVGAGNTLWTVIGSNFTVPNLTDSFIYSRSIANMGGRGGEANHVLTTTELPAHQHAPPSTGSTGGFVTAASGTGAPTPWVVLGSGASLGIGNPIGGAAMATGASGGNAGHNNLPPYVAVAQIVKIKGVTVSGSALVGPKGDKGDAADPTALDTWHNVGSAGEPAFAAGASNQGAAGNDVCAFRKDPFGKVQVRGTVVVAAAAGSPIFTLPPGYQKGGKWSRHACVDSTSGAMVDVYIDDLNVVRKIGANTTIDLVGVEFDTDTVTNFPIGPRGLSGTNLSLVTSLPSGPADGDECHLLVDATGTYGGPYLWHCRYRAATPAPYRWHVVGGPEVFVEGSAFTGGPYAVTTTYANLAGPVSLVLPNAGVYDVSIESWIAVTAIGGYCYLSYTIGATASADTSACITGSAAYASSIRKRRQTIASAATLTIQGRADATANMYIQRPRLSAIPSRIG